MDNNHFGWRYDRESKGQSWSNDFQRNSIITFYIEVYIAYNIFNDKIEFNIWNPGPTRTVTAWPLWYAHDICFEIHTRKHTCACMYSLSIRSILYKVYSVDMPMSRAEFSRIQTISETIEKDILSLFSPYKAKQTNFSLCVCAGNVNFLSLLLLLLLWYALEHIFFIYCLLSMLNVIIIMCIKYTLSGSHSGIKSENRWPNLPSCFLLSSSLKHNWLPINCMKNWASTSKRTNERQRMVKCSSALVISTAFIYIWILFDGAKRNRANELAAYVVLSFAVRSKCVNVCVCKKQWTKQISHIHTFGITVIRMKLDCIHGIVFYHKEIAFFRFT